MNLRDRTYTRRMDGHTVRDKGAETWSLFGHQLWNPSPESCQNDLPFSYLLFQLRNNQRTRKTLFERNPRGAPLLLSLPLPRLRTIASRHRLLEAIWSFHFLLTFEGMADARGGS